MTTNADDSAFPNKDHMGDGPMGLTKREYFAAMAIEYVPNVAGQTYRDIARKAISLADALIMELNIG